MASATQETTGSEHVRHGRRWPALVVLCLAQFMLTVDDTIVNVALPRIRDDLGFSVSNLAWVADAYWLMFGGLLLLGGRLGDIVGRRRLLLVGLTVFTAASLADGLAWSPSALVVSRAAQGLGSALVSPAALALISLLFPEPAERARALGVWGGIAGAGGAIGMLLGGTLTELLSWPWIFLINVPIGLAVLGLVPLLVGAGCAAALLAAFVVVAARHPEPLIPLGFFRRGTTSAALAVGLITPSVFGGMFFLLTLYLQTMRGYGPLETGTSYLTLVAAMFVAVPLASGRLIPSWGVRPVLTAGLAIMAAGVATFVRLPSAGDYWRDVAPGLALVGFGAGFAFITVTIAALAKTRPAEAGLAAGAINAALQVGGALALAVYVFVATRRTTTLLAGGAAPVDARLGGYHAAFLVGAVVALAGAVVALVALRGISRDEARRAARTMHG